LIPYNRILFLIFFPAMIRRAESGVVLNGYAELLVEGLEQGMKPIREQQRRWNHSEQAFRRAHKEAMFVTLYTIKNQPRFFAKALNMIQAQESRHDHFFDEGRTKHAGIVSLCGVIICVSALPCPTTKHGKNGVGL